VVEGVIAVGDKVLVTCENFWPEERYGFVVAIEKGLNHTLYGVASLPHGRNWIYFTEQEVAPYDRWTEGQAQEELGLVREVRAGETGD
jgi:hypothetical protein